MLFLSRKIGESVMINDDIELTILEINGRHVKIGFRHPSDCRILRREVFDRITRENQQAAAQAVLVQESLKKYT